MPNTVTRTILNDGPRNAVVLCTVIGDGSGEETAAVVVDASDLSGAPTNYNVIYVHAVMAGLTGRLSFDATTDVPFLSLADTNNIVDWKCFQGVRNFAGAGKTGDILLTTNGLGAGDSASIIVQIIKG